MDATLPELRLFVYGTLKRGWWNHARYCQGYVAAREAIVRGRLYHLPSGIPMLRVPDDAVLAEGSASVRADLALQGRLDRVLGMHPHLGAPASLPAAWGPVRGEMLTFTDPSERLRALDRLEGFVPGAVSAYRRVLVPMRAQGVKTPLAAWTYVWPGGDEDDALERLATFLPGGRWPVLESGPGRG